MAEQQKWTADPSGNHVPPERQSEFLDWLLTPDFERKAQGLPESQAEWARAHDMNVKTVRDWKKNPLFKDEWRRRADETVVSTERVSAVMDAMWNQARLGNVQAATLYMAHAAKLLPTKEVADEESVKHLSDQDLVEQYKAELGIG